MPDLFDMTEEAILAAADELVANIAEYRANAKAFYDKTDVVEQVKAVLSKVGFNRA